MWGSLRNILKKDGEEALVLPARPHVPFTDVDYLFGDMIAKYGGKSLPAEQAQAMFQDASPEHQAKFGPERLRSIGFMVEFMVEQAYLLNEISESRESLTRRFAANMLKQFAEAGSPKAA